MGDLAPLVLRDLTDREVLRVIRATLDPLVHLAPKANPATLDPEAFEAETVNKVIEVGEAKMANPGHQVLQAHHSAIVSFTTTCRMTKCQS